MKRVLPLAVVLTLILGAMVTAQNPSADWAAVGNNPGGTKYSPLTQITPANVTRLAKAWSYDLGAPGGYTVTPIAVNNLLYFPHQSRIIALNADTGTEKWVFDMRTVTELAPPPPAAGAAPAGGGGGGQGGGPSAGGRGISYWAGDAQNGPRIVIGITNGWLLQLDARTGQRIPGPAGLVNLSVGIMDKFGGNWAMNTPPALYKNLAILAGRTGESGRYGVPGDSISSRTTARRTMAPGASTAGRIAGAPASGCRWPWTSRTTWSSCPRATPPTRTSAAAAPA
jgi:quinoprotein glucose dehydrogenase